MNETQTKPETKAEAKPEVKPEAKPETKPEVKPEAKPEAKPETKPEPKPAAKKPAPKKAPLTKKQKTKIIVWSILGALFAAFVIIVLIAHYVLPDSLLAKAISGDSPDTFDIKAWFNDNTTRFIQTAFYIVLFVGISLLVPFLINLLARRKTKASTVWKLIGSIIKVLSLVIMIFVVLGVWGVDTATLLASAGIIALILGLSAQSLINDVLSGFAIIADDDFNNGDIVTIDGFRGTVMNVGVRSVKLMDAAGNIKVIDNSSIGSVINLSRQPSVAMADLDVTYDTDLKTAHQTILDHVKELRADVPEAIDDPICLGVQEFSDSGVIFRFIVHCKEEEKFAATRHLNEAVWNMYDKYGLEVPYTTYAIVNQPADAPTSNVQAQNVAKSANAQSAAILAAAPAQATAPAAPSDKPTK
jgi:small conductance mechanosensitive channel